LKTGRDKELRAVFSS